jgi:hypothetical protein
MISVQFALQVSQKTVKGIISTVGTIHDIQISLLILAAIIHATIVP